MERFELEEAMDKLILESGVDLDDVVSTLESMTDRYREELDGKDE